jgi:hypothetical protein
MTTPSIPVLTAGSGPQQSAFQAWWTTASTFLVNRVVARVTQQSSTTSIPSSGSAVVLTFDTVIEDPYSGWSASTHSWTPPAGLSGWYQITLRAGVTGAASNTALALQVNTSYEDYANLTCQPLAGGACPACAVFYVYLTGAQDGVAGAAAIKNSSSSLSTVTTTGLFPAMEIMWISS